MALTLEYLDKAEPVARRRLAAATTPEQRFFRALVLIKIRAERKRLLKAQQAAEEGPAVVTLDSLSFPSEPAFTGERQTTEVSSQAGRVASLKKS